MPIIRAVCRALTATIVLVLAATAAVAERRVALVIGNSAYEHTSALKNSRTDAEAIAAALRRLEFDVLTAFDVPGLAMEDVLSQFTHRVQNADAALLFYAGHGIQFGGGNYLVPTDARLASEFSLKRETIAFDEILAMMEASAKINLVFIDACRNNPLAEQLQRSIRSPTRAAMIGRGLASMQVKGSNTLIAFATAPGEVAEDGVGANSPFTGALLRHIETADVDVEVMLKNVSSDVRQATRNRQRPERLSRLESQFKFKPRRGSDPAPVASASDQKEEERLFWESVKDSANPSLIQSYLDRYPGGVFAPIAIVKLRDARQPPPQAPPVRASADQAFDAAIDAGTAEAYRGFTEAFPDDPRVSRLRRMMREEELWDKAKEQGTAKAYRAYLAAFPKGFYAKDAERQVAALAAPAEPEPRSQPSAPRSVTRDDDMGSRIAAFLEWEHLPGKSHFADWVDYYDKGMVTRDFAMQDQAKYNRRWPSRDFQMIPGSLTVSDDGEGRYTAVFQYRFTASNAERTVTGSGRTRVSLKWEQGQFFVTGAKDIVQRDR